MAISLGIYPIFRQTQMEHDRNQQKMMFCGLAKRYRLTMIYHHTIIGGASSHCGQVCVSLLSSHSALALGWGTPCGFGAGPAKSPGTNLRQPKSKKCCIWCSITMKTSWDDGSGDSGNCDLRVTITGKEKIMGDFGGEKTGETWCIN